MTLLRLYTEYSIGSGECRVREISKKASMLGYTSVAKTDKGTLAGSVEFSSLSAANNVNGIIGCEVKTFLLGEEITLLLYAKDESGITGLNVYSSFMMTEKSGYIPEKSLNKYSTGIIAIWIENRKIISQSKEKAKNILRLLQGYFPSLYAGLERIPTEPTKVTTALHGFFKENHTECVITNPVYMTEKENVEALMMIDYLKNGEKTTVSDRENFYLRSAKETKELFSHLPEVIENTEKIGAGCNFRFQTNTLHLPSFPAQNPRELLREKAFSGLEKLNCNGEQYINRLNSELSVIEKMGFSDYFLITEDFVSYARENNIPSGYGRGSGVGSLTAYALGITKVDPVEKGLIFERFLNEERVSMPDFDVDVGDEDREKLIRYGIEKYGKKYLCGIANYSRYALRQIVKNISKYCGYTGTEIIDNIPDKVGITVDEAIKGSPSLEKEVSRNEKAREVLRLCRLIEGRPRAVSPHPSGVILTPKPLINYVPLTAYNDETLCQYSMDDCGKLGILKIDFLGIKYLTAIQKAKSLIKEPIYEDIPPMDERVFKMLQKGDTLGVFQLESEGMKELLKKVKPESIDELCHVISLYRPGPIAFIDDYIKGKNNPDSISYPIEKLNPILEETCGCPIYQEQIMRICTDLSGFTLGKADIIRRTMAKKDKAKMTEEKAEFVSGCVKNGIEKEKAETLFDNISGFAKYAFNKSHGMAYAYLTYETAYLKALYPAEYFAARLECENSLKRTEAYAYEMSKFSLKLLPPCINRSGVSFEPCDEGVRYSLSAIKGVRKFISSRIVKEREAGGEFKDADDFINRVGCSIGLNSAYALVKSGALDVFGETRKTLCNLCEDTVSSGFNMAISDDQLSLSFDNAESMKYPRRRETEFPETEKRLFEKEYTGVDFHFVKRSFSEENTAKQYALYIKLTHTNKEALRLVSELLTQDTNGSVVRIYDVETGKTSQLKDRFFLHTISSIEEIEKIMGKENVLFKALERNKK